MKCAILNECDDRPWIETVLLRGRERLIVEVPDELYTEWKEARNRMDAIEARVYAFSACPE